MEKQTKQKNTAKSKELFKLNMSASVVAVIVNLLLFLFLDRAKHNFTLLSTYANIFILFWYLKNLSETIKTKLGILKKEVFFINNPRKIIIFFILLALMLFSSLICLICINPEAVNLTFVFSFFMTTIGMMMPTIFLLVFINFAVPSLIIPNVKNNRKLSIIRGFLILLFILFTLFCIYRGYSRFEEVNNPEIQSKFKIARLTVKYSTQYLQLGDDLSNRAKQLMSRDTVEVPFLYTKDSFTHSEYWTAENFCTSLGAKVPNYLEIYHIIFNRFDTFGEKYYWTSDRDGLQKEIPLVLHFKNMSYEIVRKPEGVTPELFCVAPTDTMFGSGKKYFERNVHIERKGTIKKMSEKPFDNDLFKNIAKTEQHTRQLYPPPEVEIAVNREKKHVNFSVKEVPPEVFNQLLQRGYVYNPADSIRKDYEINEATLSNVVRNTTKSIKLCYYPFADYGDLNIQAEKQIWEQSFCSPAFEVISVSPVLKTKNEKDSYCMSTGGRLPNIPELVGIMKTLSMTKPNIKFWTNTKIYDSAGNLAPVFVYFKDGRFLKVDTASENSNETAYTFCVTKPKVPSIVLANYKSRFPNTNGNYYARMQCPSCKYYEVPDVILAQ